jgi:hypothetical protein
MTLSNPLSAALALSFANWAPRLVVRRRITLNKYTAALSAFRHYYKRWLSNEH